MSPIKTISTVLYLTFTFSISAFGSVVSDVFINPTNGHSYFLIDSKQWPDSQAEAVSLGGNLVTISDANENQWLVDTFAESGLIAWIGLNDIAQEGTYEWISGESSTYTNWDVYEPNNALNKGPEGEDWGEIYLTTDFDLAESRLGKWNDFHGGISDSAPRIGIVEIAIPEPTSIAMLTILTALGFAVSRRL